MPNMAVPDASTTAITATSVSQTRVAEYDGLDRPHAHPLLQSLPDKVDGLQRMDANVSFVCRGDPGSQRQPTKAKAEATGAVDLPGVPPANGGGWSPDRRRGRAQRDQRTQIEDDPVPLQASCPNSARFWPETSFGSPIGQDQTELDTPIRRRFILEAAAAG